MAFQLSPGVNVSEIDLTNVVPTVGTSIGAFAGDFAWGPANKIILVDSENTLVSKFGKPTDQNFTSFFSAANFLAYTNNLKLVRAIASNTINASADGAGYLIANEDTYELNIVVSTSQTTGGAFVARYPGDLGNSLGVSMCANTNSFGYSGFTANTTIGSNIITCSSNTIGLYANTGDLITVSGTSYTIASATNQNVTIVGTATANVVSGVATTAWAYASLFDSAPGTTAFATSLGGANDEMHIVVIDENGKFTGISNTVLEVFSHVSKASDAKTDDGSPNYYVSQLKNGSKYVYATAHLTGASNWGTQTSSTSFTNSLKNYTVSLSGGVYSVAPSDANTVSSFSLFGDPDQVDLSLLITGAADATVADAVLSITNTRKDAVAFVSPLFADAVSSPSSSAIIAYRNTLTPSTSYSVMDSGWKYQFDKYNNKYRFVPLNADIAGLCARTDNIRDPWWSPAGLNRGQILNAIKLSWNPTKAQRDDLYKAGVNPVVSFPGEGIVLYGDKTMQTKPSAFDRINVRRLFIVLEKSISTAAKYSLFEFNDNFTRAQFVALVEPFLRDVKGRRGIYDYKVICDTSNNTPEVIDSNRFVGDIYIKPAKSINYIQLNFVAVRTGVNFTEVAGSF